MKLLRIASLMLAAAAMAVVVPSFTPTAHAQAIPASCSGVPNPFPVFDQEPIFVRSINNAKLYIGGTGNDTFQILHLWGSAYEKGYAQGQILTQAVTNVTLEINEYLQTEIQTYLPSLPKPIVDLIVEYGVDTMLLWTYDWTLPFMKQSFIDEMNGIAAGAGVDVKYIRMYNMFPELTKAACTIVGANKAATPNKLLHQLRALDIGPDIPIKNQAQVTVYHASDASSATFLTVGWTAMVGALTGFSANGVGIGEKVWLAAPEGADSVQGEPWMFVLRNVLEQATTMAQSLNIIENSKRTCAIHVGVGSAADNEFRGLEIAAKAFNVYNDTSINYTPGHPAMEGLVYWNKHKQPSKDTCLADLLQQYYGNVTAYNLAINIAPISQTGDFHTVTFDYNAKSVYIANSRKTFVTTGDDNGYARQFTKLDMGKLFNEQSP